MSKTTQTATIGWHQHHDDVVMVEQQKGDVRTCHSRRKPPFRTTTTIAATATLVWISLALVVQPCRARENAINENGHNNVWGDEYAKIWGPASVPSRHQDDDGNGDSYEEDSSSDTVTTTTTAVKPTTKYGVDVSFPIHHESVSKNYPWLAHNMDPNHVTSPRQYRGMPLQTLGDRPELYLEFMAGCMSKFGGGYNTTTTTATTGGGRWKPNAPLPQRKGYGKCWDSERSRIALNLKQPQVMKNYTKHGFAKAKVNDDLWKSMQAFWRQNREDFVPESWPEGNTYTNHWEAPSYTVSLEGSNLRGGSKFKQQLWENSLSSLTDWTGLAQWTKISMYGVRVYTENAILSPHVDELPSVFSVILNVDQDVDEAWPLEIIGRDGTAHNITMEPGDMIMYESHSIIHGRPFPLVGRYFANIYIHFEPTGHSRTHHNYIHSMGKGDGVKSKQYKQALDQGLGGHEAAQAIPTNFDSSSSLHLPSYLQKHEEHYTQVATTMIHRYASKGDIALLAQSLSSDVPVDTLDPNGWTPLHEAARTGQVESVKLLLEKGANVNLRTHAGTGGTPLYYSIQHFGIDHDVSQLLLSFGGEDISPDPKITK